MRAIKITYLWSGAVLPDQKINFTVSVEWLRDTIADMLKGHMTCYKCRGKVKQKVNELDLWEEIKLVYYSESKTRLRTLEIITTDGGRYVLEEQYRREAI